MVMPIEKVQVYEAVYNSMMDFIEEGVWKEGERIPGEIELANQFQVSRNSLRTAIKVLNSYNIVVCRPGIGTYVAQDAQQEIRRRRLLDILQDVDHTREVVELRSILDKESAYRAALRCTEANIKEMENAVQMLSMAAESGNEDQVIYWGSRFHEIIVESTGNQLLIALYKSLKTKFDHDRQWYMKARGNDRSYKEFFDEDRKLIQAFRDHDGELARELMNRHMVIRTKGIEEFLKENKKEEQEVFRQF